MRSRHLVLFVAVCLSWAFLAAAFCSRGDILSSWKLVDDELSLHGKVLKSRFEDHWTNSAVLRRFVAERNTNALVELAGQPKPDIARFSAYFALRNVDREAAFDAGINIVLTTSILTNIVVDAVLERLVGDLPSRSFKSAFTRAFRVGPVDAFNAATLVRALPLAFLQEWFEDASRSPSFPTCEAVVVNRLYGEMRKKKETPTTKMAKALESYAAIPGEPRIVFLSWACESNPVFKEALQSCFEDETIPYDRLVGLLYDRASFIEKNLDVTSLKISAARRSKMTNDLAQALKLKAAQNEPAVQQKR